MEADRSGLSPYVLALVVGPDQFVEIFRDDNDRDAFAIDQNLLQSAQIQHRRSVPRPVVAVGQPGGAGTLGSAIRGTRAF